jgi:MFS family permease
MSTETTAVAPGLRRSQRTERLLLPASFITTAGNAFQLTAASILVFHAGQNALSVGWLFIAVSIPQVALAVLFGRLVDRFDRRTLSVLADVASAMTAFALPVWLWAGGSRTLGSYLASFLLACSAALFMPASNALIKERIADKRLGWFNARYEVFTNSGLLIASGLAGVLFVAVGPVPLFIFNSGTFVVSAALTYLVGREPAKPAPAIAGAAGTAADPQPAKPAGQPIKRLALLYVNANLGLVVASTLLLVLILHSFRKGPWLVGVTDGLAFTGFLVAGLIYPKVSARIKPLPLALVAMLGNITMWCLEPLNWIALMVLITIGGGCFALTRISARTLLMRASPPDRAGRIFGGTQAASLALAVLATVALSELADKTTVPDAFWALGVVQAAIAIGTYISLVKPMAALEKQSELVEAAAA